ncbi:RNA polymerase sigma factor [Arthrobacter sp. M4]|uniref:RNA polymerase sigma factor n=1 Tax=Arthrobacter sp. M4 TaxID=218160 RepID=UPI001CDC9818|nr:sigma-70 family RNA polymerase sigma factor [Arthrobacter sp. M4]MCA4134045.1 sigma-70 family RNA polymerase sigma factor [Arthrobacter sp. M4]
MSHFADVPDREHTFRTIFEAVYPDVIRFLQRRTHPDNVEDVAAESLLVVWRRLDELPQLRDDARAWVFGITRNVLLNTQRGEQRRQALGVRLADAAGDSSFDTTADLATSRVDLNTAWQLLSEVQQEALALAVFEDLSAPQAATVLGISPVAFRLRLSRARRALRLLLEHLPHHTRTPATAHGRTTTSS